MKIGVLNDIHGNLPALEAVLTFFREQGCDEIIGTGDVLTIGPDSIECLHRLQSMPHFHMVSGNHERCFFGGFGPPYPSTMQVKEAAHHQWVFDQLSREDRQWLEALPRRLERRLTGGGQEITAAFVHYPMDRIGNFLPNFEPSKQALDAAFEGEPAQWVFYGHDHRDSEFTGRRRYINLGPMGCPGTGAAAPVGWITADARGVRLERLLIPYDKAETIRHLKAKNTPDHEQVIRWFFGGE